MTIHTTHPFADPDPDRVRQLRGRLGGQVSLWTAGAGADRVGLTVSSLMVAAGEPAYLLGLLDPDADLTRALGAALSGAGAARCVVQLLEHRHRDLAEQFAGAMPAPGGLFAQAAWTQGEAGPRLADATTWAEVVVRDVRDLGWMVEVCCRLESVVVGEADDALLHRRGRYARA